MPSEPTIMVYMTFRDQEEAATVSRALVDEKLAACSNIWPVRSIYRWEGKVEDEMEWAGLLKTRESLREKLLERARELHSYEVPCVEFVNVDGGNAQYLKWVRGETETDG